ncbi:6-hydroxymethylpterin diphosphokinase MptE-like protein [Nocardioides sp.]|uniref:6-hydroxymethylpterin diphosphokinase MptE-like protein n=1 Tax=Nocardioides sp. TaxID=35761 RepID=UPI0037846737
MRVALSSRPAVHERLTQVLDWSNGRYYRRADRELHFSERIAQLRSSRAGEQCFVVGNGPSVRVEDLEALRGRATFGCNRIFEIYDRTEWRPEFYIAQDVYDARLPVHATEDRDSTRFVGAYFRRRWGLTGHEPLCFNGKKSVRNRGFSDDCAAWVGEFGTVTFTALQFAAYLGFKQVVLIGIDHSYARTLQAGGEIATESERKDHFYSAPNRPDSLANITLMEDAYRTAKEGCDRVGCEVVDATRGGHLQVFPKVDLDELL